MAGEGDVLRSPWATDLGGHDEARVPHEGTGRGRLSEQLAPLLPAPGAALAAALLGAAVGAVFAVAASLLRARGVRVAYTRKLFHFGIFTGAGATHALWGLGGTNVYGGVIALLVLGAVALGDGNPFYEALARESDRPRRTLFIVVPLVTTAVGGLASALFVGPYATVGYLVAGWGDASAEPVGSRWGRHPYRVPSLAGVPARRTWEGSAAVLLVGSAAAAVGLAASGSGLAWGGLVGAALACGLVGAAVEAVSHHGTDNLTVQVAVSLVAAWLAG